jgi:hypothetical protein
VSGAALASALERAEAALEAGDAPGAAAALSQASQRCDELRRQGVELDRGALTGLLALHARCEAAAAAAGARLARAAESAGAERPTSRASTARPARARRRPAWRPASGTGERRDEVGERLHLTGLEPGQRPGRGDVAHHRDDAPVARAEEAPVDHLPVHLDARQRGVLEPLGHHQVGRRQQGEEIGQRPGRRPEVGHLVWTGERHRHRTGGAEPGAVLAGSVEGMPVARALERRHGEAARHQRRDQVDEEGGLPGAARAGEGEDGRAAPRRARAALSPGRVTPGRPGSGRRGGAVRAASRSNQPVHVPHVLTVGAERSQRLRRASLDPGQNA